jgi:two-component system sensor histidine kinase/response regulator
MILIYESTMTVRPRVLVIDDIEANLVAVDATLRDLDCDVVLAKGGNEGLRHLIKHDFAVMLLDVQMPEMDGYEVATYARQNPSTRDVPIIFLTANYNTEEGMLRGYGSGAVDFLSKPINAHVLRAKVRVFLDLYLERRRLADEVTAHQKTLLSLEEANVALRHFTHAASHDLRAPLRAITGFLQAFREQANGELDPVAEDYLERVVRASQRMDALLNSLLAYAKLQKKEPFIEANCAELAEQARADLASQLAAAGATVEIRALPIVRGNPPRLYQLFLNLLSNATKFRRPDAAPRIAVWSEVSGDEFVFCVEDNGIGIDPQYSSQVFEPFRRVHTGSEYEGAGLGLVICRQVVEQHQGRIWIESELGRGTRFYFSLPKPSITPRGTHTELKGT